MSESDKRPFEEAAAKDMEEWKKAYAAWKVGCGIVPSHRK